MRTRATSPLAVAAIAAARPLAGQSQAASLSWDPALIVRGAAGSCANVFARTAAELRGRPLREVFETPETLGDALHFGTARNVRLVTGQTVRLEAGPCPGGAVAIVRRSSDDELDLARLVAALGHELRNAFASVMLAVQSLGRNGEVESDRGRRRLMLAERELRRIECVLRGLKEVGKAPVSRLGEVVPERLARDAIASLGPQPGGELVAIAELPSDGAPALLDGARVRLALEELFRHAIRAVAAGGSVALAVERRSLELAFELVATGPSALHPNAVDLAKGGTDLGLAVAEAVARAHGGYLRTGYEATGCRLALVLPQRPSGT